MPFSSSRRDHHGINAACIRPSPSGTRRRWLTASPTGHVQGGEPALTRTLRTLQPISLIALLVTLVLLFGFQGEQIVQQPLIIALLAVPIIIQVYLNAGIAYAINRALGVPHNVACPSALIGASNFRRFPAPSSGEVRPSCSSTRRAN
jgi:hypothetical protein